MTVTEAAPLFQELKKALPQELALMGGKASALAILAQKNFPVPPGAVLFQQPTDLKDMSELFNWWKDQGSFPVAVRSSASGEDGTEVSYAGQFITILNVKTPEDLSNAVSTCFEAVHRVPSQSYAEHFQQPQIPMHVLIQRMINSQFSGVYFSQDPRSENSSWLVEMVEGQGEQLVSGQVTPYRFSQEMTPDTPHNWKKEYLETVVHWGQEIEKAFGYLADIEWAIDQEGQFWILQSRPITAKGTSTSRKEVLSNEWQKVTKSYPADSAWDGHTFAEWTGIPSELSYDIWRSAFEKDHSFDLALKSLGYEGFGKNESHFSLLEKVYGRLYLNLKSLEPIYFGTSPYKLMFFPRPHLEFCWRKLTPAVLLRAPLGIAQMIRVAWTIQTNRSELAKRGLAAAKNIPSYNIDPVFLFKQCQSIDLEGKKRELRKLTQAFSQNYLQSTFLLTLLIESTTQGLLALLTKDLGKEKAAETIYLLTGRGLETIANKMHNDLSAIQNNESQWQMFLSQYGHRGPGELDLANPRWLETSRPKHTSKQQASHSKTSAEDLQKEILGEISTLRRPVFLHEWQELQKLMQIREEIKMALMKPYAQIRWLASSIGNETGFSNDEVFWLSLDELLSLERQQDKKSFHSIIQKRKEEAQVMKSVDLPMMFSLQELQEVLNQTPPKKDNSVITGVSLSPGVSSGIVHFVDNPEGEDLDSWPDNYVLIAEATDPGWTPLFARAKAVVVSRGGVLSHCAIVAREMGLPAVGEVRALNSIFKEGERVWVDGNHGLIKRAH
ncbi:PEP/pyruvate-binding domain-containing protein [Bdellovibrio svalbardensis]|uniref:PEP-utilizing enzyme n=1 Tax=Bdellovibrio svalbardensis TaxID=2972972 RepID=A0ABT6DHI4_9BACT|nr:PEP/pyruvate-binding domain-containing protein [Bdellovibrio svalbardensis]MDG0816323.1 PEP-utilizing enzyme [Bdellovibrio svalbardensis]